MADKFCASCHHARNKHDPNPENWICASPKNAQNVISFITGRPVPLVYYCMQARNLDKLCGLQGRWHQTVNEAVDYSLSERKVVSENKRLKNISIDDL